MTVILLNGVGSAGKTSIARALQDILAGVWLHVPMDAFIEMLPKHLQDDPCTFHYLDVAGDDGPPAIAIHTGKAGELLLDGMRRAVAAMARVGNDLIVDDVLIGDGLADYEAHLAGVRLLKVGVLAPLEVLEAREAARDDRMTGLARWQFPRVHMGAHYDLEVESSTASPREAADALPITLSSPGAPSSTSEENLRASLKS
jgi:chloramphenicol 3-O phosphotransferase